MGGGGGGVVVRTRRLVGALVLSSFLCGGLRFPFSSLTSSSSSSSSSFCLAEEEEEGRMASSKALPSWHPRGAPRSKTTREEEEEEEEDADAAHRWGGSKRIYAFEEKEKKKKKKRRRRGKRRDTSLLEDVREEIAFETKKLDIAEATLEKEEDLGFANRVVADEGDAKWPLLRQRERNFNRYCLRERRSCHATRDGEVERTRVSVR